MANFTKLNGTMKKAMLSAIFMVSCVFSFSQSVATYWQYNRPGPIGYDITDICYVNNQVGYACGTSGTISRTTDAGRTWLHDYLPGRPFINAISFPTEKVGFVVLLDGRVAKTTNRGITWSFVTRPTTAVLNNLYFFDENNGFVVGDPLGGAAGIFKTTNGGSTWVPVASSYPVQNRSIYSISFLNNGNIGYACGATGHITKTTDGGATWTNISMATGNPVTPTGAGNPATQSYSGLAIIDAQTVLVSSLNNSNIVKTINGGTTWVSKVAQAGTPSILVGSQQMLNMVSNGNDVAVTAGANCGTSHDAGETWTFKRPFPAGNVLTGLSFYSLAMTPDKGIKMAGSYGVMVDSASAATKWDTSYYKNLTYNPSSPRALLNISALDQNNIIACGNRGILFKTTDGGKTWLDRTILGFQLPMASPEIDIKDVKYVASDAVYMCASNGYVYRSLTGGDTWPENTTDPYYFTPGGGASMLGLEFISKNTGWVCGGNFVAGGAFVYRTADGGLTWTKQASTFTGATFIYSIDFINGTTGFASGNGGRMYKSTDGGINWVQQTVPATVTTNLFSTAFVASADTGWAVGISRVIYTTDGGTTWTQQTTPTNATFNKVMAVNGRVAVAFANGGVCYKTIDGGTTWTDFSAPSADALFGATYAAPYNSNTSGVNPANVDMFVVGGKASGAQSPTIFNAKLFYTAPVPPAPVVTNITDKCPASGTAKGKLTNLPLYTQVDITVDGDTVLYSPQDSSFTYFTQGTTTAGNHTINVRYTNNGGTSVINITYNFQAVFTTPVILKTSANVLSVSPVINGSVYQWYKDGQLIAGATSTTYTATTFGNYSVMEIRGACTQFSNAIGVLSLGSTNNVVVYPVPASTAIYAQSADATIFIKSVSIFDERGTLVLKKVYSNSNLIQVDISRLSKGLYFAKVETSGNVVTKKFLKQ